MTLTGNNVYTWSSRDASTPSDMFWEIVRKPENFDETDVCTERTYELTNSDAMLPAAPAFSMEKYYL